jgi:dihydrodipicolinate synthase/N-acetylneuraminate lyase
MLKIQGILVPVSTPFDYRGEVYKAKLRSNVERLNAISLAGYVAGDLLLTAEEKTLVWELVAASAKPGKLLGAAASAPSVRETVALANRASELGFQFAFVRAAAEFTGETRSLYYRSVADGARIPLVVDGDAAPEHPNVLKVALTQDAANLFAGFKAGSTAALVAVANAIPYSVQLIWEAYRQREDEAGADWQERIRPLVALVEAHGVAALKCAMDLNSYYGGVPRLPWTPVAEWIKPSIASALHDLRS